MTQRDRSGGVRLSPAGVVVLFALNFVPLVALLPAAVTWSGGALHSSTLLPVGVLPTVVLATYAAPAVHRAQLVVAVAMCAVTIVIDARATSVLVAGAISTIGTLVFTVVLISRSRSLLRRLWGDLRLAGLTDPLTGALNRRGAVAELHTVVDAAAATGQPVGLATIDLDHFKRVNDDFGHAAGDELLREVCDTAREVVGTAGLVVRSGGEELLLLTVGDPAPAAEELRKRLAAFSREPRVTLSAGVVRAAPAVMRDTDDLWAAVGLADMALYQAKAAGRDRVVDGGDFFGADTDDLLGDDDPATHITEMHGVPVRRSGGAAVQRLFEGFGPTGASAPLRAVERAKNRRIDSSTHVLYQTIIGWIMVVGMVTTIQQMVAGSISAVQGWVILPGGWLLGGTVIVVMRKLTTSWALTPVFAGGSLFELAVVYGVGAESRPAVLMVSLLVGLLLVLHWPRWPVAVQMAVTAAACVGAALAPGRPARVVGAIAAITAVSLLLALAMVASQRRREEDAEEELRWRALTDPLTGLGNRRALQHAASLWPSGYVAMIDVDSFKALNDRYGHGRGDAVLRALALDLHDVASGADPDARVFRIGGDEFAVAGPGTVPPDLAARIEVGLRVLPVTVSTGIAEWGRDAGDDGGGARGLWEALAAADTQMFGRKRARQT